MGKLCCQAKDDDCDSDDDFDPGEGPVACEPHIRRSTTPVYTHLLRIISGSFAAGTTLVAPSLGQQASITHTRIDGIRLRSRANTQGQPNICIGRQLN